MAETLTSPPVLSTPAENIFEDPTPAPAQQDEQRPPLSDHDLAALYEVERTAAEIVGAGWARVALQFPDAMLRDAARVVEALTAACADLLAARAAAAADAESRDVAEPHPEETPVATTTTTTDRQAKPKPQPRPPRFYILADTSYSACCVDEIAAEHVDAQAVVHYGRACLSPTARLPVVYVYTRQELDVDAAAGAFARAFQDLEAKVVVVADVTYQHHVAPLVASLREKRGYGGVVGSEVVRDPTAAVPNRRLLRRGADTTSDATLGSGEEEVLAPDADLKSYALFHVSEPPPALLLALHSRFASLHVLATRPTLSTDDTTMTTGALLRRRFARVLTLAAAGTVGILVNTLSVAGSLESVATLRRMVAARGKKSYTFVVGKLNAAKLANFAEVDGWVVVACWESGLVNEGAGFYRPVITPFELGVALMPEERRVWGDRWWAGIETVKEPEAEAEQRGEGGEDGDDAREAEEVEVEVEGGVEGEESAPPVFDLRTGKLVSNSQPMRVPLRSRQGGRGETASGALIKQGPGELATVNGVVSPGAEFLRSQRTWQGLGSDFTGDERSTVVEEGRSGVARGYTVGEDDTRR